MSFIDQRLRQGAVAGLKEHFGKTVGRKDVSDKTTRMIDYLDNRYKEVLDAAEREYQHMQTNPKATLNKPEREGLFLRLYRITVTSFWYAFWDKVLRK